MDVVQKPNGEAANVSEDAIGEDPQASLGLTVTVLKRLSQDGMPQGVLGPENVPTSVMAAPIKAAMEWFVFHQKNCHNKRCSSVPTPLWPYLRMRPKAIQTAGELVHRVLWTLPDQTLVRDVRRSILDQYVDLAGEVASGALTRGKRLDEVLNHLGVRGPAILASVLWAAEFKPAWAEDLFRVMVFLVRGGGQEALTASKPGDGKRSKLEVQLRDATREKRGAEQAAADSKRDLAAKEKALKNQTRELNELRSNYKASCDDLTATKSRLREVEVSLNALQNDADRASRAGNLLRKDLRELQQKIKGLELQRSDLALQVASDRRETERLRLALDLLPPEGADAVWVFLHQEEERIREEQRYRQGGDKVRADEAWSRHTKFERAFLDAYPEYRPLPPPKKAKEKLRKKRKMRLVALGGSDDVGASCYLLELGSHRILVDCGIKPGISEDVHPSIDRIEKPDALILTHAHTDHIGWVPALIQRFGDIDIYCSAGTAGLLPIMLDDCRRHYMRKVTRAREIARAVRNAAPVVEEYEHEDVKQVPNLVIECKFGEPEALPFGDIALRFFPAGHILGASSVLVEDQSGRRVFFSGDFSSFPQLTVPAAEWPEDLGELDLLVLESTYGRSVHGSQAEAREKLISIVRETIENRGGSVILASFALGRAQELLSVIAAARASGAIPSSVPVHVDGMIKDINPIYRKHAQFDLPQDGFLDVIGEADRRDVAYQASKSPRIIVTTSGMMTGGPVVEYARHLLPDKRNRIVFSGYQDEGAPSKALLELERSTGGPRIVDVPSEDGETVRIEAALPAKHVSLSAHADQRGLLEYAGKLSPKVIALVHGRLEAQEVLKARLLEKHRGAQVVCAPSELPVS